MAKWHEKIVHQRKNFPHQKFYQLAKSYDWVSQLSRGEFTSIITNLFFIIIYCVKKWGGKNERSLLTITLYLFFGSQTILSELKNLDFF